MRIPSWMVRRPNEPMALAERDEVPGPGEVIVEVAGCGVCHTDLGFFYDGVPTRHPLPLTLGHEVSGRVVEAGPGDARWLGRAVVVPAVIPCGTCPACLAGRGGVCPKQVFPGNDVHGGFGTHLRVPCTRAVPGARSRRREGQPDASRRCPTSPSSPTPSRRPTRRSSTRASSTGDLAVFVGAGGVGGFGVQIAAALGAKVVAIDTSAERRDLASRHGANLALEPGAPDAKAVRGAVRAFAEQAGIPSWRWKIFETSGTPQGQATAFGLLGPAPTSASSATRRRRSSSGSRT